MIWLSTSLLRLCIELILSVGLIPWEGVESRSAVGAKLRGAGLFPLCLFTSIIDFSFTRLGFILGLIFLSTTWAMKKTVPKSNWAVVNNYIKINNYYFHHYFSGEMSLARHSLPPSLSTSVDLGDAQGLLVLCVSHNWSMGPKRSKVAAENRKK